MTLHEIKKNHAGDTDIAVATLVYCGAHGVKSCVIHLSGDGAIYVKEATNADTINDYYRAEITRAKWVKIYDDNGKIYDTEKTVREYFDYSDECAFCSWAVYSAGNTIAVIANFINGYFDEK